MISARTKAGLSTAKAFGTKLGMSARNKAEVRKIAASGAKADQTAALERIESIRCTVESALSGCVSLRTARLNRSQRLTRPYMRLSEVS
jgi:hypothetical protein